MERHRIQAIFWAELRAALRERLPPPLLVLAFCGLFMGMGASGPNLAKLARDYQNTDEVLDEPTWDCKPGTLPKVAIEGQVPDWLQWPDPLLPSEDAEVLLLVMPEKKGKTLEMEIVELQGKVNGQAVQRCVVSRAGEERRRRLDALGISEDTKALVKTVILPPGLVEQDSEQHPLGGLSILAASMFLLLSIFYDFGPRARASGWLESFLVLPGSRADLVMAWWLLGSLVAGVGLFSACVGTVVGSYTSGVETLPPPYILVPVLAVCISAIGVRVFVDVPDMRTALVQSVPALWLLMLLTGLAKLLQLQADGLEGWMPYGGLFLAIAGQSEGRWLPALTALSASALLLVDTSRTLDHLAVREGSISRAAARYASGDFRPEAILLVLIAAAGMGTWAPPELVLPDPVLRNTLSMVVFLLIPSLVISIPLRLERSTLLSLRPPKGRQLAALPLWILAAITLSSQIFRFATWLFPSSPFQDLLQETLGGFEGIPGILALSVAPAICEEFLFRGAIFGLLRKCLPALSANVLQALGFGLLHGLAFRVPHTFILGIVLGFLVQRSGSLWLAVGVHLGHNLLAVVCPPEWMEWWLNQWFCWIVVLLGGGLLGWLPITGVDSKQKQ